MDENAILQAAADEAMADVMEPTAVGAAFDAATIFAILRGLRDAGMPLFKSIAWLPIVIELLLKYGPEIVKIVTEIIEAWRNRNETPQTFTRAA